MITANAIARAIAMNAHPAGKAGMQRLSSHYPANVPVPVTSENAISHLRALLTGDPWHTIKQCEGCPKGMNGEWRAKYAAYLCGEHLAESDRGAWREYDDTYSGQAYMEYDDERW